ncbi:MAG TPA: SigB/SigF/SigG family RNA polymerase sigma factor [Solirubrobacterales bacterium]|jgi:RNA polymerase sigma-B factor|nr:SigB/SigF/SigG family RNA polymerase sigma factor [Solirubrobacterales bacterium]
MSNARREQERRLEAAPATPEDALAGDEELLRRYATTRDEAARDEIVRRYLPFARSLAFRYSGGTEPADDLVQVASVGLMAALERFDPARGVPFIGFAGPTILGELRRHFRDRVWTLRVPRGLQERIRDVEEVLAKLSHDLERSPTVTEIAAQLDVEEVDVLEAFAASDARRTISYDRPATEDGDEQQAIAERIGAEDPGFELVEDRSALRAGVGALSELEREVLRLRFVEDLTQSRIAEHVGYSQMHVSRIIRRALACLRESAEAEADES